MSNGSFNNDMILDDFDVDFDDMGTPEPQPAVNVQKPQRQEQPKQTSMQKPTMQQAYEMDLDFDIEQPVYAEPAVQPNTGKKQKKQKQVKPKKEKPQKQPKAPKVAKEPKQKKEKPQKPAKNKDIQQHESSADIKKNKTIKTIGIIVAGVVVFITLVIVALKLFGGDGKHLTLADEAPPIVEETVEDTIVTEKVEDNSVDNEIETSKKIFRRDKPFEQTSTATILNVGSDVIIPVTVNTKLDGDEQYYDYYSYIALKINDITVGYDNVITHIQKHNQVSTNKLNIDDKETLLANNKNSDLTMYSVSVLVPDDYPSKDNKVYINPSIELTIEGTEEAESIITDKYVFATPKLFNISGKPEFNINETTELKWVGIVPSGLDRGTYNIKLTYTDEDGAESVYTINGIEIPEQIENETQQSESEATENVEETETVEVTEGE